MLRSPLGSLYNRGHFSFSTLVAMWTGKSLLVVRRQCWQATRLKSRGLRRKSARVIFPSAASSAQRQTSSEDGSAYIKLGENDNEFTLAMTELKSKKKRSSSDKILLEGRRLINDALASGLQVENIYFTQEENIQGLPLDNLQCGKPKKVFYKKMKIWSDLTTCPGVMGVFKKPSPDELKAERNSKGVPLTVICDNVRDPGNMGAILRTVAAAGCRRILLMKGCVDIWESKVLRSGSGAHFRFPIYNDIPWEMVPNYVEATATVYLADNQMDTTVAANTDGGFSTCSDDDEEKAFIIRGHDGTKLKVDKSYLDKEELEACRIHHLQCKEYTDVDYNKQDSVLIVGGETHGLSPQSFKLARDYGGMRVHIPSVNGVESLNTAVAASVIIFEIRRQLLQQLLGQKEHGLQYG